MPQLNAAGNIMVWIPPPPWRRSWTFGCPGEVKPCVGVVGDFAEALIRAYDPDARIERATMDELHISWHWGFMGSSNAIA
jgi:hypothetical protein